MEAMNMNLAALLDIVYMCIRHILATETYMYQYKRVLSLLVCACVCVCPYALFFPHHLDCFGA